MIIGDLDLDLAEQDPDYLARVKAFLVPAQQARAVPSNQTPLPSRTDSHPDSAAPEHALR